MSVCFVPWLHMHQPFVWLGDRIVSNIEKMLNSSDSREQWDAKLMLRAYKNPAKYILTLSRERYKPRIILDFSGILLETIQDLDERKILENIDIFGEKIGPIISEYKKVLNEFPECIEFAGTAYSHCYFPITPKEDWRLQIEEWRETFKKIFGQNELKRVKGFWLPEMAVPGKKEYLKYLIKCVREYYEWIILPIQSMKNYENLSYEKIIEMVCMPHALEVDKEKITAVFRVPTYFIDQQAGCDPELLYKKCLEAKDIFSRENNKPALIITASDGENGNVMMNEFFPNTFALFLKEKIGNEIFSLSITEFLEKFYKGEKIRSKIELKDIGACWIDGHRDWTVGAKRAGSIQRIISLSKKFHELKPEEKLKIKKWLLVAETSCYLYWGTEYWFEQGEKFVSMCEKMMKDLSR